jgi:hypothetical protein
MLSVAASTSLQLPCKEGGPPPWCAWRALALLPLGVMCAGAAAQLSADQQACTTTVSVSPCEWCPVALAARAVHVSHVQCQLSLAAMWHTMHIPCVALLCMAAPGGPYVTIWGCIAAWHW